MDHAFVPMRLIGPILMGSHGLLERVFVPMATYETPLWHSTLRGAKVSELSGGIKTCVIKENMTRSIAIEADTACRAAEIVSELSGRHEAMSQVVQESSQFASFLGLEWHQVGTLLFGRLSIHPSDASGHNMVTKAADGVLQFILKAYPDCRYVSVSGNFCTDKKVSAVNSLQGRGKYVIAESIIPRQVCGDVLKTSPEKIVNCHIKKNLIGSIAAGSLCSANAHYANALLAVYLATGQDAANIVEGSQGITHAELRGQDLYFSVTLPNLIVGTVGNGKDLDFVKKNMTQLGCTLPRNPGENSRRLAMIMAATVHCAELSLMAALTNEGELMRAHLTLERAFEPRGN